MARRRCQYCGAPLGWFARLLHHWTCPECSFRMSRGGGPLRPPSTAVCGCCDGKGEHRCGHECDSCDGAGRWPDSPPCGPKHGADCTCAPAEPAPPLTADQGTTPA